MKIYIIEENIEKNRAKERTRKEISRNTNANVELKFDLSQFFWEFREKINDIFNL